MTLRVGTSKASALTLSIDTGKTAIQPPAPINGQQAPSAHRFGRFAGIDHIGYDSLMNSNKSRMISAR
jgi:hypothetical protein